MGNIVAAFGNNYPADPRSGAGIRIETKRGLTWSARLDYSTIAFSPAAPTTGLLVAQNADGSFTAFDISSLPLSPQFIATLLSGPMPAGYPPRRGQFLQALRMSGAGRVTAVRAAVPSDPDDPIAIAWENTLFVSPDGALAQLVKNTLGLSNDDLNTILNNARTLSE
ncbi:hypothetical protein [Methylobacterium sp. AMS5]|uniref:hypothetical protein n=1 Tax=Methylobacterium sp. AMS5 TaxID=925818 RepID=UPI00074F94CD|nr:hypothetical protein [Methylobacterium sp. AMS5]AMB46913.1 hypothetical protein Y590_18405 [Methylobacterium sp. AMS5]